MTRTLLLIPAAAALALAACNDSSHTIVQNGPADPMANELKNAPPVQLPPSIASSKVYRCKDNSLVYLDWLEQGGKPAGANFRTEKNGTPTQLLPGAEGKPPFTAAGGYSLTGTSAASSITLERPGKGSQSCKA
jgi:hypothetical protein